MGVIFAMARAMRGMRKQRKLKRRLMNRKPNERYEWLMTLMNGTDCILRVEDKYRIYRRLEDEFSELSELTDEEAGDFDKQERCASLADECAGIADELEPELPEEYEEYSRTEMMTAGRRQEEDKKAEGSHSVFRIVLLTVFLLIIALLVCRKIPMTRAWIGCAEEALSFNSLAIKSYRVAGKSADGWEKAVRLEQNVVGQAEVGSKVKFGKSEWIVLAHRDGRTLLIADEVIGDRAYHNQEGDVTWADCRLRSYLNGKYLKSILYPSEEQAIADTEITADVGNGEAVATITDKVFIPSEDDIWDYEDALGSKINNLRLRDPGETEGTTLFVSARGDVVSHGYPTDMSGCLIRPMMWVQTDRE